ncbi:MAG: methionine adenosyltransferase domain-containing protein [Alphaproteobacteria bacterium]
MMKKTAEYVSIGHPDKVADFISSYILDKAIEQDPMVKYAVEVLIKENIVILGGEIKGNVDLSKLKEYVVEALAEIGYNKDYAVIWGKYAIDPCEIKILNLIGQQSDDINKGVEQNGWGDQGVFVGYACQSEGLVNKELYLARKLNKALYEKALCSLNLGIDIKTQITLDDTGNVETAIVAIPMLENEDLTGVVVDVLGITPQNIIINGTGVYKTHSSIADCGVSGRKLACDFYSTACPIGGGSPWTKDASKADLTLNLYARKLAIDYLEDNDEAFVYLSSCIGQSNLTSAVIKTIKNGVETNTPLTINKTPTDLINLLGLRKPIFAELCKNGLT